MTIATKASNAYVEGYCNYGESPLLFPVIVNTTEADLWTAYEAVKDDILMIDQQAGGTPLIVEKWMGSSKIQPTSETGRQTLMDAIDAHMLP